MQCFLQQAPEHGWAKHVEMGVRVSSVIAGLALASLLAGCASAGNQIVGSRDLSTAKIVKRCVYAGGDGKTILTYDGYADDHTAGNACAVPADPDGLAFLVGAFFLN